MNFKKTKIVATLGPATQKKEVLKEMLQEGVNVFRINFSHASYEDVKKRVKMVRELCDEFGFQAAILADLQGPKLRVGKVEDGAYLKEGNILTFTNEDKIGDWEEVYMTYKQFAKDVEVGERILIDDGKLILKVVETDKKSIVKAEVIHGGPIKSKKGVNLPNTNISLPALTDKDIEDAKFACEIGVDWFALSFVRHAGDLRRLQDLISKNSDFQIPIIAKIEKPEAVSNIDDILENCDGIMVARGDLGVEIPMEDVPGIQKLLVKKAKANKKPVIIATQMMESMIENFTPTRAEVNDVANSVLDGADAVMLSGETSVGKYPVEVIRKMAAIVKKIENSEAVFRAKLSAKSKDKRYITDSICLSATDISRKVEAKAIVMITVSGYTAFQVSASRPNSTIVVFTPNKKMINVLSLIWGVTTHYYNEDLPANQSIVNVNKLARKLKLVTSGDFVINLSAMPAWEKGFTNTLRLIKLD